VGGSHISTRSVRTLVGGGLGAVVAASWLLAGPAPATTSAFDRPAPPAHGLSYHNLHLATHGPCAGEFLVVGVTVRGAQVCSHGPDATTEFNYAAAKPTGSNAGGGKGGKPQPSPSPSPSPTSSSSPSPSPSATSTTGTSGGRCGTDGPRVQAIYAHAADVADGYSSLLPSLRQWVANTDAVFANSAAETGGVRRLRLLTDASCVPTIADVTLSAGADADFTSTINDLKSQGFNRADRKYLIWVDANMYCGIGTVKSDDSPGATNANNVGPSYSRVDRGCWGGETEAHELMHNMGGVQLSAPHADGGWHCTDEYDRMCYQTGNTVMTYPCSLSHDHLFDCGHDDYYSTDPSTGSYLTTHWNAANSVFLTSSST
jgi:hypothetical protein